MIRIITISYLTYIQPKPLTPPTLRISSSHGTPEKAPTSKWCEAYKGKMYAKYPQNPHFLSMFWVYPFFFEVSTSSIEWCFATLHSFRKISRHFWSRFWLLRLWNPKDLEIKTLTCEPVDDVFIFPSSFTPPCQKKKIVQYMPKN